MTAAEIIQKYGDIIEDYLPVSNESYLEICEAIIKAHLTYKFASGEIFEKYAQSCIESQLSQK